MEAATATARSRPPTAGELNEKIAQYVLVALLLALPVGFGIRDLVEDGDLSRLANNIKDGLSNGAILALIAIGYTLVYGIIELINFAHGDVFMIGSVTTLSFFGTIGLTAATGPLGTVAGHRDHPARCAWWSAELST